jgi:hypothetical protein
MGSTGTPYQLPCGLSRSTTGLNLPSFRVMPLAMQPDGAGWTDQRRELHALLVERTQLLADYYQSAVYFLHTPDAPVRMSHLAHAVRELCNRLPDAVNVVKLERSNTENKVPVLARAWEKAGLPDRVDDFPTCSTTGTSPDEYHFPRSVVAAAADLVVSTRVQGNSRRRAALMIVDPHAPVGHTAAERDPTVDRWVTIIKRLFPFVHAFDKEPNPIPEDQLTEDFLFLEDVMRGILAPLAVVADLDDLLAQTRPTPQLSKDDAGDATTSNDKGYSTNRAAGDDG